MPIQRGWQMGQVIDLRAEHFAACCGLYPALDRFDIQAEQHADHDAQHRAGHTHARPAHEKDAQHRAPPGADGAQDRNIARLVLHHHDQAADDVERGHDNDQCQDQEHDVPLHLHGGKEAVVVLLPVDHPHRPARRGGNGPAHRLHGLRVVHHDLDMRCGAGLLEENLRSLQRQEHVAGVVLVHADLEHGDDPVGAHAGDGAERGRGTVGRQQREFIADGQAELTRQAHADRDRVLTLEIRQRTGANVVRHRLHLAQVLGRDAPHQPTGRVPAR